MRDQRSAKRRTGRKFPVHICMSFSLVALAGLLTVTDGGHGWRCQGRSAKPLVCCAERVLVAAAAAGAAAAVRAAAAGGAAGGREDAADDRAAAGGAAGTAVAGGPLFASCHDEPHDVLSGFFYLDLEMRYKRTTARS